MVKYEEYLTRKSKIAFEEIASVQALSSSISSDDIDKLIKKKFMATATLLLGPLGGDRFMLGERKVGAAKCMMWVALVLIALIVDTIFFSRLVSYAVLQFGMQTNFWLPTISECVVAVGMPTLVIAAIATLLIVLYIIVAIFDMAYCYSKAMKANYRIISAQYRKAR